MNDRRDSESIQLATRVLYPGKRRAAGSTMKQSSREQRAQAVRQRVRGVEEEEDSKVR